MNDETYEALKNIILFVRGKSKVVRNNDILAIESWIDETAKEHEPIDYTEGEVMTYADHYNDLKRD